ncbi:MAG: chemotaxis-specific protein-glutamate methyltransferase CheB [Proteobacteria bacterium]|nr:chemotaxis-specific protein-glutamate methyltransferase CheB [Pseudomonadota bacterium]
MRIAIVNSTDMSVEIIRRVVTSQPGNEIAWVASSGAEAVEKTVRDKPDLILMDLTLPIMDGVNATGKIMKDHPCAILIVTEAVSNHSKIFEAMGRGALDAVGTPVLDARGNVKGGQELLKKIEIIARLIGKESRQIMNGTAVPAASLEPVIPMIAIGSSTGGPKVLADILSRMPVKLGASIVIVQHVDVQFVNGLVEWLGEQTKLKVVLAKKGMHPEIDKVFIAGTNDHLVLGPDLAFHYTEEPKDYPYRPSVDTFFYSIKHYWPVKGVAVLLTGMGRDGAKGLLELRKAGWYTIAQNEKTSAVYGMPKAAVELEAAMEMAAMEILPVEKIVHSIVKQIKNMEGHL